MLRIENQEITTSDYELFHYSPPSLFNVGSGNQGDLIYNFITLIDVDRPRRHILEHINRKVPYKLIKPDITSTILPHIKVSTKTSVPNLGEEDLENAILSSILQDDAAATMKPIKEYKVHIKINKIVKPGPQL